MGISDFLLNTKAARFVIRSYLNHEYKRFGKMTHLTINPASNEITLTAELAGEERPLDARIQYRIEEQDGRTFFVPSAVQCSREWMTLLAEEVLSKQPVRIEIPPGIATMAVKALKL